MQVVERKGGPISLGMSCSEVLQLLASSICSEGGVGGEAGVGGESGVGGEGGVGDEAGVGGEGGAASLDLDAPLAELGVDSLGLMRISSELHAVYPQTLTLTLTRTRTLNRNSLT